MCVENVIVAQSTDRTRIFSLISLCVNSQHLEDEGEAAQHAVGLRRQLDG